MSTSVTSVLELRDPPKAVIAVVGSVVLNLAAIYLAGLLLLLGEQGPPVIPEDQINEVVISLEELMPQMVPPGEEEENPARRAYLDTFANQETEMAPENARFESDRNTAAMSQERPREPSEDEVPTQAGEEKIPFISLQEHRFQDGPDEEIPESAASPSGVPVPPSMAIQTPQTETVEPDPPDPAEQVVESENREMEPEEADPKAQEMVQAPADSDTKEPTERKEVPEGEEGGASETLEMANVDLAKMKSSFSDDLEVLDESVPMEPEKEDAMPERNPELVDPTNPLLEAPMPAPSAPLRAQPISRPPQEAATPLPPGAMASRELMGEADTSAFSPERNRNKMNGSLSNIGRTASLDAEATELGRYKKRVSRAIERRWHQLRIQNESFVSFGSLKIRFEVTRNGQVDSIKVIHDDANAVITNFSLQAIASADIPPMPDEIIDLLGRDPLEVTYDIIIY